MRYSLKSPVPNPVTGSVCLSTSWRFLSAGLVTLVTGLGLVGCDTVYVREPKYPIYMQNRPASAAPIVSEPVEEPAVNVAPVAGVGNVTSSSLPPPPSQYAPQYQQPQYQQPQYQPPPPPLQRPVAAQPATAPMQTAAVGVSYVYIMQPHDTLFGVSRRFGVPIKAIYDLNDLSAVSPVSIGQKIKLPATARDAGVEERASGKGLIRVVANTPPPRVPSAPVAATTPVYIRPGPPVTPTQPLDQPSPNRNFPGNRDLATLGQGMFVWPTRGTVLMKYGQLAPNVRNDGINIAAPKGTPVVAAADGIVLVVLTVQNQTTRDLGNTIYIQNGNGWYTGYSHLDMMTVKAQQRVKQGQVIGTVGQTGAVTSSQLHFEIRYTPSKEMAKPIDPNLVLPTYR